MTTVATMKASTTEEVVTREIVLMIETVVRQ